MVDAMNSVRLGVDPSFGIAHDGIVVPAGLPQLVEHFEIVIAAVVPIVVSGQVAPTEVGRGPRQI